jgi:hypothetical protein
VEGIALSSLTPGQQKTLPARQAFAASFDSPEEKSDHYRRLAQKSHADRVVLPMSREDVDTLAAAYELLGRIAAKARAKHAQRETEAADAVPA